MKNHPDCTGSGTADDPFITKPEKLTEMRAEIKAAMRARAVQELKVQREAALKAKDQTK